MKIETFQVGPIETNCYFIINEDTNEMVVVDPGEATDLIFEHVSAAGYKPVAIILTHGHFDHITGVPKWIDKFGTLPIYADEHEKAMLENPDINMTHRWGMPGFGLKEVNYLKDGEEFELVGLRFKEIWTPGHTYGSCEYYIESEKILFSGDSLFYHSVGRTDLPTGDGTALVRSLKQKIMVLPGEVKVLPGHDIATCIADERTCNPYIR